jgi:hypothetical protein
MAGFRLRRFAPAFAAALLASAAPALAQSLTRGPYLQQGSDSAVVVRWRTSSTVAGRVRFGSSPTSLTSSVDGPSTTEHAIEISGLSANTKYFYSVGSPSGALAGGDSDHFFVTAPPPGASKSTRVWVLGDPGTKNSNQRAVRDAYYAFTGSRRTDLWLMLGDNAYSSGTDSEYQLAVFDMYPTVLRNSVLWPTLGNHDAVSSDSSTQGGPYYSIFTLPKNGQCGGTASGTEAYYSFDYGNIHFVCLDSSDTSRSSTGAMATWLRNDLAQSVSDWIVAFWHHPPYVKSNYDSDVSSVFIDMRQNFLPILEAAGVDLVLAGHSHNYQRSFLIDGHYGLSDTLTAAMIKDGGDGRESGTGAYQKSAGNVAHEGAVYVVAGSSGQVTSTIGRHPVMYTWKAVLGSLVLDFDAGRLDVRFLRETGAVDDFFTIRKGTGLPVVTVQATDGTASESGPDGGAFTVTRSGPTAAALTVNLTIGGSAAGGSDYAPVGGTVTIPSGASSVTVTIAPIDDAAAEGAENVTLTVAAGAGYVVGAQSTAEVAIADNDSAGTPPPPPPTTGRGLLGEYFNTWNLLGASISRVDPAVDYDWGADAPLPGINPDGFGVRWTGFVTPEFSETYTFYTVSNDGARLWVGDRIVIDKGIDQPLTEWSGTIDLIGGQSYPLRLEYYDNTGQAVARLLWSSASTPKQVVPADRLSAAAPVPSPGPAGPEPPAGSGGGGGGGCGATGAEGVGILGLLVLLRRRRPGP